MAVVDFLCLANSYKHSRKCVAGLRVDGGGWIRPVSGREQGELDSFQVQYPDKSEPRILDVIRAGISGQRPQPHHPEDCLIDGTPWIPLEQPASMQHARMLAAAVAHAARLLGSVEGNIPAEQFQNRPAACSLALVEPHDIRWHNELTTEDGRRRARVAFRLQNVPYDLPLTDPAYVKPLLMLPAGIHRAEDLWIPRNRRLLFSVSLSEPFGGLCYKLVAGVVVVPPDWEPCFDRDYTATGASHHRSGSSGRVRGRTLTP